MVSIKALVLMVAAASAANAANVEIQTFQNGDCTGLVWTLYSGPNGGGSVCHAFGGQSYGAFYKVTSGATCVFKSWENSNCSGLATTRTITGTGAGCQAIANDNSGNFHVVNGLRSVSITCS
ncbi:hypothetical protein TWF694_008070 [Orbilia ellipsospora]|uniref:Uncharacterized protein n=1 Tax=Orbilia ellipsospora TaxID=2528407 RepID=A0AAV9XF10_9PEZI